MTSEQKWEIWQLYSDGLTVTTIMRIVNRPRAEIENVIREFKRMYEGENETDN